MNVKYNSLVWPPPRLRNLLDELIEYVVCPSEWCKTLTLFYSMACRIHKLSGRKSEKNFAKRVLLGYFGIRDLGKFNKYQQRLTVMASYLQVTTQLHRHVVGSSLTTNNQSKPHNIDIHATLLEVVHSREQPQDEDSDSELAGDVVRHIVTFPWVCCVVVMIQNRDLKSGLRLANNRLQYYRHPGIRHRRDWHHISTAMSPTGYRKLSRLVYRTVLSFNRNYVSYQRPSYKRVSVVLFWPRLRLTDIFTKM